MKINRFRTVLKCIFGFCLLTVCLNVNAQQSGTAAVSNNYTVVDPAKSIEIPFEIYNGELLIKPVINGRECRMYVENGVLWDQLVFFGSGTMDSISENDSRAVEIADAGNGGDEKGLASMRVDFGNVKFTAQPTLLKQQSLTSASKPSGVDGQISALFFKNFVTEIDFDKKEIILHPPQTFTAPVGYTAVPMTSEGNGVFTIPAILTLPGNKVIQTQMSIDFGGPTGVTYYYEPQDGLNTKTDQPKLSGYSIQDEFSGYSQTISCLQIGKFRVKNFFGDFIERNSQNSHLSSTIGLDVLKRFNAIYDYAHGVVYLKSNSNF